MRASAPSGLPSPYKQMPFNSATQDYSASAPLTCSKPVSVTGGAWPETVSRVVTLSKVISLTRTYQISHNLITRDEVKGVYGISDDELISPAMEIYCNASEDVNRASVEITEATIGRSQKYLYLTRNGTRIHSLRLSGYPTLGELVNQINGYDNWTCRLLGPSEASPVDLVNLADTQSFEYVNRITVELINNWKVDFWINVVTDFIEGICRRSLVRRTITETHDGDGGHYLQLKQYPIVSVISITLDDDELEDADYQIYYDEGLIYFESGWPSDERNIEVKYDGGYSNVAIPYALKNIAMYLFSFMWNRVPKDVSLSKEKMGSYSYQLADRLTDDMKEQLSLFTAYGIQDAIRA